MDVILILRLGGGESRALLAVGDYDETTGETR